MISPPNTSERTMKTVVGRATIRIQIPEIVLRNRVGALCAVVSVGKSRTDTPSRWTSIRRIAPLPLGTCRIGADQDIDVEARSRWGRIRKSQSLLTDEEVSLISLLRCGGTLDRPWLRDRKDRPDYTVFTGEWEVGRIYETRGGPDSLRWFWSMTVNGPMTRSDRVATLEEAKAQFQKSWDGRRGRSWRKLSDGAGLINAAPLRS